MSPHFRARSLILTACLLSSTLAHAQTPPTTVEPARSTASWGVIVIATSIAAGAALTGYGLTFDCSADDHACHRRASLPIWGGVGVAAAGSLVGLRLLSIGGRF